MPSTAESGEDEPLTLADKLQRLRRLKTPRGKKQLSYDAMAREITAETGIPISQAYLWELCTGRTTSPGLEHLEALAAWFKVPIGYLTQRAGFEQLNAELGLLEQLKTAGVTDIRLNDVAGGAADPESIRVLLGDLHSLNSYWSQDVREAAARVGALSAEQRQTLDLVLSNADLLEALQSDNVVQLAQEVAELSDQRLLAARTAVQDGPLLDALLDSTVREITRQSADLSPSSRQALLAMAEQLRRVEQANRH
jgi:transcriptional regulator with XRE-family HTH domain